MFRSTLAWSLFAFAACDQGAVGKSGIIVFTPDDCGALSCDLSDRIATESTLALVLEFQNDDLSLDQATMESDAPSIVEVTGETGVLNPRFRLHAMAPGRATLTAHAHCYGCLTATDSIVVDVVQPDDIDVDVRGGTKTVVDATTDRYDVPTGTRVDISSRPMLGGRELTGQPAFTVTMDDATAATRNPLDDATHGDVQVTPPDGTHAITLEISSGPRRTIQLVVGPQPPT